MASPGTKIADLFKEHKESIDQLLSKVSSYLQEKNDENLHREAAELPVDEYTVLKFLLSAQRKKGREMEVAYENLVETLHFRVKHKDAMDLAKSSTELLSVVHIQLGGFLGDELVLVNDFGGADFNAIKAKFETTENVFARTITTSEQLRLILDKRTRETGRLSKMLSVILMDGISFSKSTNMTVIRALGQSSKSNEVNYPQMMGRAIIFHANSMFRILLNLARPVMSKNTIDKLIFCGAKKGDQDCSQCPFIKQFVDGRKQVPVTAGGLREPTTHIDF